jgi:hypothetical protein
MYSPIQRLLLSLADQASAELEVDEFLPGGRRTALLFGEIDSDPVRSEQRGAKMPCGLKPGLHFVADAWHRMTSSWAH